MQDPHHADPTRRVGVPPTCERDSAVPLPLGGQKPRLLDVAFPVIDVVLGVRDIPKRAELDSVFAIQRAEYRTLRGVPAHFTELKRPGRGTQDLPLLSKAARRERGLGWMRRLTHS
jgi:hypothetical protein